MTNELSAVSVILVFVIVAFSLIMPSVWENLGTNIGGFHKTSEAKNNLLKSINSMLFQKTVPLFTSCFILGYLLTPTSYSIIVTSNFDIWEFDLLNTLFVIINISIYGMGLVVVNTFRNLLLRRKEIEKYFEEN